jgi:uncharacterized protein
MPEFSPAESLTPDLPGSVLPEGTQVSTRVDRVRFPDGREISFRRRDLTVRKHAALEGPAQTAAAPADLQSYIIYRCIVGSRAYGLDHEGSDTDRRGIFLPPAEMTWSLYGVPEQLEDQAAQSCYWEIQKFLTLALRANPTALEALYTPLVELAAPLALELREMRPILLSRLLYGSYNGYVMSQFRKLEGDLRNRGEVRWKHAMHLIRLLLSGIGALQEGCVPVRVEQERERLLSIRHGETAWEDVDAWRLELHRQFEDAFRTTALPARPDYARANEFLIRARRSMVSPELRDL